MSAPDEIAIVKPAVATTHAARRRIVLARANAIVVALGEEETQAQAMAAHSCGHGYLACAFDLGLLEPVELAEQLAALEQAITRRMHNVEGSA